MSNKYGLFSEPTYNACGDPYKDRQPVSSRHQGLNFKATKCKRGTTHTNDMVFDRIKPLYEGEKYVKTYEEKKAAREAKLASAATDKPFRPANPGKKSSGLGSYHGHLGPKYPHLPDFDPNKINKTKGDFEPGPRNIVVNPPKKGTYGFNKTTLGEKMGVGGSCGEYSYKPSPYDEERKIAREQFLKQQELKPTDKPFKPPNPSKKGGPGIPGITLGGKGAGVAGEYEYKAQGVPERVIPEPLEKSFRPPSIPKKGYNCTLTKFPPYIEDPLEVKLQKEREERLAHHKMLAAGKPMVPSGVLKEGPTRSVMKLNIIQNFKSANA